MNKKGFIYIFEIVIVSVILMVSLPYMITSWKGKTNWDKAKLTVTGEDLLGVLDEENYLENIMEKDTKTIISHIDSLLGADSNIISFNLKSVGAYKNEIRVGCNCSEGEWVKLKSILTPIYFNGRMINFTVFSFNYKNLPYLDMDVIFLTGLEDVRKLENNPEYFLRVKQKIKKGVGIVEYSNLRPVDISVTEKVQKEIFGIHSSGNPSGKLTFKNREDPKKLNYGIGKLFYGVDTDVELEENRKGDWILWNTNYPVRTRDADNDGSYEVDVSNNTDPIYEYKSLEEGDEFEINNIQFSVEKVLKNGYRVLFNVLEEYKFEDFVSGETAQPLNNEVDRIALQSSGGQPGIIVNRTRENGRTVWVSEGNGDDIRGLVKTSVLWASRRGWWNLLRTVSGEKVTKRYFVSQGEEVYEPYKVLLELWYLY